MPFHQKHLLNSPSTLVIDALEGVRRLNPQASLDSDQKVLYQTNPDRLRVALISGGGAGHEPAHSGFVGEGILTAAVSGNIFASPNAGQVRRAIDLVDGEKGTLIVVKNYTGDILQFGLAKEQYAAAHPEKAANVRFVIVGDDVSVGRSQGGLVGRRGLAGTVLVYKIAGALARRGASLDEVYNTAQLVASRIGTIGVGLEHCHVPGTKAGESHLKDDEIEIGMGTHSIHNEPGFSRLRPAPPLSELMPKLLKYITSTTDSDRSFVPFAHDGKDEVVLLVNNLGGVSTLEMGGVAGEAVKALENERIKVARMIVGTFMTSLNMPGFSLTLLLLPRDASSSDMLSLLDEPATTPGWTSFPTVPPQGASKPAASGETTSPVAILAQQAARLPAADPDQFHKAILSACDNIMAAESEITRMDQICGDGDCGLTLKAGASGVLAELYAGKITGEDVIGAVIKISEVVDKEMDGTSGALYSIFFSALAQGLHSAISSNPSPKATVKAWSEALKLALERLYTYTPARAPSRTLIDPLAAFIEALASSDAPSFAGAVRAASSAAEATKDLEAKAGRASYVEKEKLKGIPDPGAWGIKTLLEGLEKGSKGQ